MIKLWNEFKAFALGGNMLDLALGFIVGTAFAALVESLAGDVLMQLIAAVIGTPNFDDLVWTLNGTDIHYGKFITGLVNFLIICAVLFLMVKLMKKVGLGNFRAQGQRECPYCKEFVAIDALKCKYCTADIDPAQAEEEDAELLAQRNHAEPPTAQA